MMDEAARTPALTLIDHYVERAMPELGAPGFALAVTGRDGPLPTRTYGYADLGALTPVDDETLFESGSIGKTFTAVCVLQLAEEGIIDLHAPVTAYLPWFAVRSQHAPITIHHLLSHTAGIIEGTEFPLDARFEVWALRDTDAAPPGGRGWYSNVGYKALGLVLEAVTGKPYAEIVQERIFDPLGMMRSVATITHDVRRRLAVGYVPFYDDRPWRPAHGLAPATWLETNTGDGSLASTAEDLATFLRMLLNGGAGPNGRLLTAATFALMRAPHAEFNMGVPHGYGLFAFERDARHLIGHEGDMVGNVAAMLGDVDAGMGVAVMMNGMCSPGDIADFALRTIIAAGAGEALPEPPEIPALEPADYVGEFRGESADLVIEAEAGRLILIADEERFLLEPLSSQESSDEFVVDDPKFSRFLLSFGRDATGSVVELTHGGDWYAADAYEGTRTFETLPEWAAFAGHYRSYNPWLSNFRIVTRKGQLWMIYPRGYELPLTPDGEGFRIGDDPESPERISFDTIVTGEALRARLAGSADYYRFFTP
ncbi:MAG: serine hydrolase domain-containing protein [Thermomicrobiales bacterium]